MQWCTRHFLEVYYCERCTHTHTSQRIRNCLLYSFYIYPCWHFPVHSLSHWMMDRCEEKRKRNVLVHVSLFRCILWHYNTASVVVIQCVCVSFSLCFAFRLAISMRCRWWYHFIIIWARRRQDNRTTMCDVRTLGSLCVIHIFYGECTPQWSECISIVYKIIIIHNPVIKTTEAKREGESCLSCCITSWSKTKTILPFW